MKSLYLAICLLTMATCAFAQDKIFTTTQKAPIEGEVVEVALNEIRYKPTGRPNPIISVDKQDVVKIVYGNGEVFMINNPLKDYGVYTGQHKWNAKLDLLSPVLGYTNLFLEHSIKPGRSVEYQLNLIGLGKDQNLYADYWGGSSVDQPTFQAKGAGIGIGMKFLRLPDYVNGQVRLRHILQGSYIKPNISLSYYTRNFLGRDSFGVQTTERKPVFAVNPNITFGRQFILDNAVSLEIYASVGFSIDNVRQQEENVRNDSQFPYPYYYSPEPFNGFGYTRFSDGNMGLTLGAGIRVGYLFDFKKQESKPIK